MSLRMNYAKDIFAVREGLATAKSGRFVPGDLQLKTSRPVVRARRAVDTMSRRKGCHPQVNPIRLAMIIDHPPQITGGTERQLLELLTRLDRERIHPYLIILRGPFPAELMSLGFPPNMFPAWLDQLSKVCPVCHLDCNFSFGLRTVRGLIRLLRFLILHRIEIIQTFFTDSSFMGLLAGIIARKKIIVSRRSCGHDDTPARVLFLSLLCRGASRTLANSKAAADAWRRRRRFHGPAIDVLRNGTDIEAVQAFCKRGRETNRTELGLPLEPKIVGVIANLRPVKALDSMLDAARVVLDERPRTLFVVVGSGPLERALKAQSVRLGIRDKIVFAASQSRVEQYLASFDIGILSSLSEGLSNAIMEYMAASLPVVATDVGGNRELVVDGVTGFLVPPKDPIALSDSILKLLDNSDLRERMGRASLEKARSEFSMGKMVQAHEDYYEAVALDGRHCVKVDCLSCSS